MRKYPINHSLIKVIIILLMFFNIISCLRSSLNSQRDPLTYSQDIDDAILPKINPALDLLINTILIGPLLPLKLLQKNAIEVSNRQLNNVGGFIERLPSFEEHLNKLQIIKGKDDPSTIRYRYALAWRCEQIGLYDKALVLFSENIDIVKNRYGPYDSETVKNIISIAEVYYYTEKYDLSYDLSKEVFMNIENKLVVTDIETSRRLLELLGANCLKRGQIDEAEFYFNRGQIILGLIETMLKDKRYHQAEHEIKRNLAIGKFDQYQTICLYTQYGLALAGIGSKDEAASKYIEAIKKIRALCLQTAPDLRATLLQGGFEGGAIRAYRELASILCEKALNGGKIPDSVKAIAGDSETVAFILAEETKARSLVEALIARSHGLDTINFADSNKLGLTTLQKLCLKDDEILLEYVLGENAVYIIVLESGKKPRVSYSRTGLNVICRMAKRYLDILKDKNSDKLAYTTMGGELFNILLKPVLKEIVSKKKIIIVPDGILGLIPFDSLILDSESEKIIYVGDKWQVKYIQSATILSVMRNIISKAQNRKILFAIGNPIYGREDLYSQLPESEEEIRVIAGILGVEMKPPDILLGRDAIKENIDVSNIGNYKYLHFSTHGDVAGKLQKADELFMLLGKKDKNNCENIDQYLTVSEILRWRLRAELVVLSACMTGDGYVIEGEGVLNFARAFQYAGARNVVVSLWKLKSSPTKEFMEIFYKGIQAEKRKSESLRIAKLKIREKYPHPYYWASFILYGD